MRSIVRVLLVVLVNVAVLAVLLEVAGNISFLWQNGRFFYARAGAYPEGPAATTNPFMTGAFHAALHPYFGFIYKAHADLASRQPELAINNHGFLQSSSYARQNPRCCDFPSVRTDPNEVIVGVFGGSVAGALTLRMQDDPAFAKALAAIPRFANKPIRILSFAFGGHKQPQQLMILTYYLSLGQPLDLIVNVDGINELNSGVGLLLGGIDVGYPDYSWIELANFLDRQAQHARNPEDLLAHYHLLMRQRWERQTAQCRTATCYSLAKLVQHWHGSNARDDASAAAAAGQLFFFQVNQTTAGTRDLFRIGDKDWNGVSQVVALVADNWATSSTLMQQLARSRNITYIHALQPNPWFRRSTPYVPKAPPETMEHQQRIVPIGYTAFIAKGEALRDRGVNFADASAILDDEPNSIYSDDVGHYTPRGYDLLAAAIARALAAPDLQ